MILVFKFRPFGFKSGGVGRFSCFTPPPSSYVCWVPLWSTTGLQDCFKRQTAKFPTNIVNSLVFFFWILFSSALDLCNLYCSFIPLGLHETVSEGCFLDFMDFFIDMELAKRVRWQEDSRVIWIILKNNEFYGESSFHLEDNYTNSDRNDSISTHFPKSLKAGEKDKNSSVRSLFCQFFTSRPVHLWIWYSPRTFQAYTIKFIMLFYYIIILYYYLYHIRFNYSIQFMLTFILPQRHIFI